MIPPLDLGNYCTKVQPHQSSPHVFHQMQQESLQIKYLTNFEYLHPLRRYPPSSHPKSAKFGKCIAPNFLGRDPTLWTKFSKFSSLQTTVQNFMPIGPRRYLGKMNKNKTTAVKHKSAPKTIICGQTNKRKLHKTRTCKIFLWLKILCAYRYYASPVVCYIFRQTEKANWATLRNALVNMDLGYLSSKRWGMLTRDHKSR